MKFKLKTYTKLFTPSPSGVVMYVFFAAIEIALKILNQSEIFRQLLRLLYDVHRTRVFAIWTDHFLTTLVGKRNIGALTVGLFWVVVGLILWVLISSLARFIMELDEDLETRNFIRPAGANRYRSLRTLAERTAFRVTVFIVLVMVILGPLTTVLRGMVFINFLGFSRPLQYAVWFVSIILMWHIVVILSRLVALRARLFG